MGSENAVLKNGMNVTSMSSGYNSGIDSVEFVTKVAAPTT